MRAAAAVLLIMGINLLLLLLLDQPGAAAGGRGPCPSCAPSSSIAYAGLAVYVVAAGWRRPAWLTSRPILDVLLNAGLVGHLKCMAVRVPHIITLLVLNHVALLAFGVRVPLLQIAALLSRRAAGGGVADLGAGAGAHPGGDDLLLRPLRPRRHASLNAKRRSWRPACRSQAIASVVQIIIGLLCIRSQVGRR